MNEEKKTFEAPVLTSISTESLNLVAASEKRWLTNSYEIPDLNKQS